VHTELRNITITLSFVALAASVSGSSSSAVVATTAAPVLLGAGPRAEPSDRPGGGFLRVTFSPDGDGRGDRVSVRVGAAPGDRLVLDVHPESNMVGFRTRAQRARSAVTNLAWDGLDTDRLPRAAGSYLIRACSAISGRCSETQVMAHLRILSVFAPVVRGVSPGETIPVEIASDRAGSYTLDLAPAVNPRAAGVGAREVAGPGRVTFETPAVAGGLWLLRVRSGSVTTYFPLVVHESRFPLDHPPRGTALAVHPYITWRAYDRSDSNRDGQVDSWYSHPFTPVVPLTGAFERVRREPVLAGREASPGAEQAFARWMQAHELSAQHVTDIELGRMPLAVLQRYSAIVFPGHTEYYERATYDRLISYRNHGGHLYFLQGNSFYGEVSVGRTQIVRLSYRFRTRTRSDFRIAATGFRSCCWPPPITPR
jgi:hypothetical protein